MDENLMNDVAVISRLVMAIQCAWGEGCPVAAATRVDQEQKAHVALRRWNSFARRNKKGSLEQQVEDLAKGLRDAYEANRELVGPLMTDYRYLASVLAEILLVEEFGEDIKPSE